jgi:hypothetical protein
MIFIGMANLIRLKQIQGGNEFSASVALDFSSSYSIISSISSSFDTTVTNLSSSNFVRLNAIDIITASYTSFSQSIVSTIVDTMNANTVISSSAQLDGTTLRNITIEPMNSDGYSLTVSGAIAIVDATNLVDGGIGDIDSTVPAQIWLNGIPPIDPSNNNTASANQIDLGEF